MGDNSERKLGKRIIHGQVREIIYNLHNFMKMEADRGGPILLEQTQKRVAAATGVSRSSVQRILRESRSTSTNETPKFTTPRRKWRKKVKKSTVDDFGKAVIRQTINEFKQTENQRLSLKTLLPVVKEKIDFKGSIWSLRQVLKEMKIKWKKNGYSTDSESESNDEENGHTVFIKEEPLDPDVEMQEETSEVEAPFEAVYSDSNDEKKEVESNAGTRKEKSKEDKKTNINIQHLNKMEEETIVPDILTDKIKTESLDIVDDMSDIITTESSCPESNENFEKASEDLKQNLADLGKHPQKVSTKSGTKTQVTSSPNLVKVSYPETSSISSLNTITSSLSNYTATTSGFTSQMMATQSVPQVTSLSQPVPTIGSHGVESKVPKQYLVIVPNTTVKESMFLPRAGPSCIMTPRSTPPPISIASVSSSILDTSETFTVSLTQIPESKRIGMKKTILAAIEIVEKLDISPEMLVIGRKI